MWSKIITIKITKDLNYFSLYALDLFNTQVLQFELKYWNKWTFLIYWDAPVYTAYSSFEKGMFNFFSCGIKLIICHCY